MTRDEDKEMLLRRIERESDIFADNVPLEAMIKLSIAISLKRIADHLDNTYRLPNTEQPR